MSLPYTISNDAIIAVNHLEYDSWFNNAKNVLQSEGKKVWLVSEPEQCTGIIGFVNCLRREPGGHRTRCVSGIHAKSLVSKTSFKQLLDNDLVMNVYRNGQLGSYR